jgi:hypothetical protein
VLSIAAVFDNILSSESSHSIMDVNSNFSELFFLTIFFHLVKSSSTLPGICLLLQLSILATSSTEASLS